MSTRRNLIRTGLALVPLSLSGCIAQLGTGSWKSLAIENRDADAHTVTVTATGDFQKQQVSADVGPSETETVGEFVPQLDYPHDAKIRVRIDDAVVAYVRRRMRFDLETITVVLTGPESVEVRPTDAAVTTRPSADGDSNGTITRTNRSATPADTP